MSHALGLPSPIFFSLRLSHVPDTADRCVFIPANMAILSVVRLGLPILDSRLPSLIRLLASSNISIHSLPAFTPAGSGLVMVLPGSVVAILVLPRAYMPIPYFRFTLYLIPTCLRLGFVPHNSAIPPHLPVFCGPGPHASSDIPDSIYLANIFARNHLPRVTVV